MGQVPSGGVTLSHRMESLSVPGPAGPWWLASRTLPPARLSLTKLQSHRLPPCPGEHPPSASLLPAHRTVSFWTGLSHATLSFDSGFMLRKHLLFRAFPDHPVVHSPPLLPGLCTLFTAVGSNPHCLLIVSFAPYCHVALWVSVVLVCKMEMTLPMLGAIWED